MTKKYDLSPYKTLHGVPRILQRIARYEREQTTLDRFSDRYKELTEWILSDRREIESMVAKMKEA